MVEMYGPDQTRYAADIDSIVIVVIILSAVKDCFKPYHVIPTNCHSASILVAN